MGKAGAAVEASERREEVEHGDAVVPSGGQRVAYMCVDGVGGSTATSVWIDYGSSTHIH